MTETLERLTTALADQYEIKRELGTGGMATVYLARDLKHNRDVAFKVLKPELAAALGPDRFLREIKIAAQLQRLSTALADRYQIQLHLGEGGMATGYFALRRL